MVRHLAARHLGKPLVVAAQGRAAIFPDGIGAQFGIANELPPLAIEPIAWTAPDLQRRAIASAIARDYDEVNAVFQPMDDATYAETLEIIKAIAREQAGDDDDE
jgi:hypothetical protein